MVSPKCVTFRQPSCERSNGTESFKEPDGMITVDLNTTIFGKCLSMVKLNMIIFKTLLA